jgi:CHAT domain-containing protein
MNLKYHSKWVLFLPAAMLFALACGPSAKNYQHNRAPSISDIKAEYHIHGDYQKVAGMAAGAANNYHQKHQPKQEASALLYLAETNLADGNSSKANSYLEASDVIAGSLKNDSLGACINLFRGEIAAEAVKPDSAKAFFDRAQTLISPRDSSLKFRLALDRVNLSNQKNATGATDSLTGILLKTPGIRSYDQGFFNALAISARIQYINQNGSPDSALVLSKRLEELVSSSFAKNYYLQTLVYRSLCRSALGLIDYETSVKQARKELAYAKLCHNATLIFYAYYDMQQALGINQDMKNSLIYADSANAVIQKYFPEKSLEGSLLYKAYTNLFRNSHSFGMAKYYARKSVSLDSILYGKYSEPLARAYLLFGNVYSDMGRFDSMVYYSQKSLAIRRAILPPGALQIGFTLDDLSRVYNNMDKPQVALPMQKEFEQIYRKNYGPTHSFVAWAYDSEADSYGQLKQYDKAIAYNNKALGIFIPGMATDTGAINRASDIPFDMYIPDYFTSRIQIYFNHSLNVRDKKEKIKYLREAYRISQAVNRYIESYASHFDSPESVAVAYQRMFDCYRMCADLCYRLYTLTGDEKYRNGILSFSENKRAAFLRSGVLAAKSIRFSGVPDTVVQKENTIRAAVTAAIPRTVLQKRKDSVNRVYAAFLQRLSKDYPNYYRLKYLPYDLNEKQIQQWLPNDSTAFAEYLYSMERLYILITTKKGSSVIALDNKDSVKDKITQLSGMLRHSDPKGYYQAAYQVYDYLVKPVEQYVKPGSRIIICADGPISTLNFEALPMKPRINATRFYPEDFLANRYNFSYAVSAFSLVNNFIKGDQAAEKGGAYFAAPGFDEEQKDRYKRFIKENNLDIDNKYLGYLYQPFMTGLGNKLAKTWKVSRDEGNSATETRFKEKAWGNNVVQVGSHALLNDVDPMKSCLVFAKELSKKPKNDGYLYLPEIYDQKLNADLIILTACETGGGQLKQGEGMMSLSYGFQYAGCKSAVMSLWPIDEKASAAITESFYNHLANGEKTSLALYHAKKDFLKTAPVDQYNPFYWSGLVMMGQDASIQLERKSDKGKYLWLLLAFTLSVSTWVAIRKKKEEAAN